MSQRANAAQLQRWNGKGGHFWIAHRERHLAGHQHLIPHLFGAAVISPGEQVLDVGCGCGATTIMAARAARGMAGPGPDNGSPDDGSPDGGSPDTGKGPQLSGSQLSGEPGPGGSVVGLDLSRPMLEVARRLAAEAGTANAGFVQGDAQACPLRRGSRDVVISSFGVMFFEDPAIAFTNIAATLRPGGRLAFLCWQDDMLNEVFAIPLRAFGAHLRLPGPATGDLFTDPRRVTELLTGAGFEDVQVGAVREPAWMGSDVADVMSYLRGMPRIRILAADLGSEALTERVLGTIAEQYAARQRPDGVWVGAAAWLVTATVADRRSAGTPHGAG